MVRKESMYEYRSSECYDFIILKVKHINVVGVTELSLILTER